MVFPEELIKETETTANNIDGLLSSCDVDEELDADEQEAAENETRFLIIAAEAMKAVNRIERAASRRQREKAWREEKIREDRGAIAKEIKGAVTTFITQSGLKVPPGQPGEQRAITAFTLDLLDCRKEETCLQCIVRGRNEDGTEYIKQNVTLGSYETPERAQEVQKKCWQAIKDGEETYTFPPA